MGLFNASTARAAGQMKIFVNVWEGRRRTWVWVETPKLSGSPELKPPYSGAEFYGARYLDSRVLEELREDLLGNGLVRFDDRNGFLAGLLASQ